MNTTQNIETVKTLYAAFGAGDIPKILSHVADDVEWEFGAMDHGVPWLKPGRGRKAAESFFETLRAAEFKKFEVLSVMGDGPYVVGLVSLEALWKPTGKTIRETCEGHVWRFDAAGRITGMRHLADTHHHFSVAH